MNNKFNCHFFLIQSKICYEDYPCNFITFYFSLASSMAILTSLAPHDTEHVRSFWLKNEFLTLYIDLHSINLHLMVLEYWLLIYLQFSWYRVFIIISIKYSGTRLKLLRLNVWKKGLVMDQLECLHHFGWLLYQGNWFSLQTPNIFSSLFSCDFYHHHPPPQKKRAKQSSLSCLKFYFVW